jgi:lysyl-tRNA synthetase class 2
VQLSFSAHELLARLHARHQLLQAIRAYFHKQQVLEVETPYLSAFATPDPQLFSVPCYPQAQTTDAAFYLHTSPEYAMKRLLASGSGDIFQLARVFRQGEVGRWHQPEFTLLEWYRLDFDFEGIIADTLALLAHLALAPSVYYFDYKDLFLQSGLDCAAAPQVFAAACQKRGLMPPATLAEDGDAWRDFWFSFVVAPALPKKALSVVRYFPATQAALAAIAPNGCAYRFEVFYGALELANGFVELTDPSEQAARFAAENARRMEKGLPAMPIDVDFLTALAQVPPCAGVALGVDRLALCLAQAEDLAAVLPFFWQPERP